MAYLDLSHLRGRSVAAPRDLIQQAVATLSNLEWQVLALARRDGLSSLELPGRWSVLIARIFGGERANPRLADPRLEALRRIAVLAWHKGDSLPEHEIAAFHAAGYSAEQLGLVLDHVGGAASKAGPAQ